MALQRNVPIRHEIGRKHIAWSQLLFPCIWAQPVNKSHEIACTTTPSICRPSIRFTKPRVKHLRHGEQSADAPPPAPSGASNGPEAGPAAPRRRRVGASASFPSRLVYRSQSGGDRRRRASCPRRPIDDWQSDAASVPTNDDAPWSRGDGRPSWRAGRGEAAVETGAPLWKRVSRSCEAAPSCLCFNASVPFQQRGMSKLYDAAFTSPCCLRSLARAALWGILHAFFAWTNASPLCKEQCIGTLYNVHAYYIPGKRTHSLETQ